MKVTGSTNVKAFAKGQSYKGLREHHFDNEDRREKGISKDAKLEKLNRHFDIVDANIFYEKLEERLRNYNAKPSQQKNKARQYSDIADYVEKRRSRKNVNKDFHGIEFMMVSKVGSKESWEDVVKLFGEHGVSEEDTLNSLNGAFRQFVHEFNDQFSSCGLAITEADTNLDEKGAPHLHARLVNTNKLKNDLPDTSLANALKHRYEKQANKDLMGDFRSDTDRLLIDLSSEALKDLAKERGFEFEGLEMIRTEAADKGLTHEAYKERQERKNKREALDKRQKHLDTLTQQLEAERTAFEEEKADFYPKKQKVDEAEAKLKPREDAVASQEAALDEREAKIQSLEDEAKRERLRATTAKEEAEKAKDEADAAKKEAEEAKEKADKMCKAFENARTFVTKRLEDVERNLTSSQFCLNAAKKVDKGFITYAKDRMAHQEGRDLIDQLVQDYEIDKRNASVQLRGTRTMDENTRAMLRRVDDLIQQKAQENGYELEF